MAVLSFVGARGTTAERTAFATAPAGFHFFDTTLTADFIWNGAAWVAAGSTGFGTYASRPAAGQAGRVYTASDSPVAQFVDDGAAWRPLIGGQYLGTEPPAAASFTAVNGGGTSLTQLNGALLLTGVNDGAVVTNRGYVITNSSATGFVDGAFAFQSSTETTAARYSIVGLMMYENGTGKRYTAHVTKYHAELYMGFGNSVWTNDTTRTVSIALGQATNMNGLVLLRMRVNGANVESYYSPDGITWVLFDQRGTAATFTTAPDRYGVYIQGYNTIPKVTFTHLKIGAL